MALVTSSSFSILVNGSPSNIFAPSRGLRQGDPLSPFLFILMMEGLGRSIKQAKALGKIKGLQLMENGQALTHQQFVDDTMLQGIPTVKEASVYKQILNDFAMAIGMEVNLSKSKIFFLNTNIAIQRNISKILGFQRDSFPSKYLGIPLTDRPMHKSIWEPVLNKMQDKVKKWTIRSLNLVGRLVLTKRDFLWGKEETRKKWALVSWDKICKPKSHGGLGLDDQEVLSKVLGAKLWWRWVKEPKAQWAKTWKEKYASSWQTSDLIRMSRNIKGSYIWNKAWENRSLVQKNSFWEIRAGDLAPFWEEKWQQEPTLLREDFMSLKQETDAQGLNKVKDFWNLPHNSRKWRSWRSIGYRDDSPIKIKAEALISMLKQRKILVIEGQDQLRWGLNKEGTFNLKEAKNIILNLDSCVPMKSWQQLWSHQGWMKIKLFMWLVHHKKILTWDNIRKRGIMGPSRCQLCEAQEEIMEHILNNCTYTT
eukprot:PITA_25758